jgi:chemotaxis methyl-accepting protein methylase/chemotaxis receptor (MCP) glutamine deamidase CheD
MRPIAFRIVEESFRHATARRIEQGAVCAGVMPQQVLLRSCICVGFYFAAARVGAMSHITGFAEEGGHDPKGALDLLERALARQGLALGGAYCFILGGAGVARHVYDRTVEELARRKLTYEALDVLGRFHRKVLLEPEAGRLTLFKKLADAGVSIQEGDSVTARFHDKRARLTTGATTFFRNRALLTHLRETVLPQRVRPGQRLTVWCAGCSMGLEVYSVAMTALDWAAANGVALSLKVLGSDISAETLQTAMTGEYPTNAMQYESHKHLFDRYAERLEGGLLRMGAEVRRATVFKQRDIREGSRRHRFDFVICDHVLLYFSDQEQAPFIERLAEAVAPGGYLYLSTPSQTAAAPLTRKLGFTQHDRAFYQKR